MSDFLTRIFNELTPRMDLADVVSSTILRLTLAAFLGGIIGLEREVKGKSAGLRTNMFICFGAAMFTVLSERMAIATGADVTRIAAQIIPGIGFIGAGSILHSRGGVSGLTTAATLFVVASVGMAVGAGQFLIAIFATIVIFLALHFLGWVETHFHLKVQTYAYEVTGENAAKVLSELERIMEDRKMESVQLGGREGRYTVQFTVEGSAELHRDLLRSLRESGDFTHVEAVKGAEQE